MRTNLGATKLKVRRRKQDPMRAYDELPAPLRAWLSAAARPWSPASCRKIWRRAKARGEPLEAVLALLDRAERKTLARDNTVSFRGATGQFCAVAHADSSSSGLSKTARTAYLDLNLT